MHLHAFAETSLKRRRAAWPRHVDIGRVRWSTVTPGSSRGSAFSPA